VSKIARTYIAPVIASGMSLLLLAAGSWSSANMRQFAVDLNLAFLASVWGGATTLTKSAAQSAMIKGE